MFILYTEPDAAIETTQPTVGMLERLKTQHVRQRAEHEAKEERIRRETRDGVAPV